MFHTCFVINHNIWIMALQFLNLGLHKTIYKNNSSPVPEGSWIGACPITIKS